MDSIYISILSIYTEIVFGTVIYIRLFKGLGEEAVSTEEIVIRSKLTMSNNAAHGRISRTLVFYVNGKEVRVL